jgi:hypothetical protein
LVVLMLVTACSIRVPQDEIYGVYVAEYDRATERVIIDRGGTFTQEVRVQGADKPVTNTGRWTYDESKRRLGLQDCLWVNDGFGKVREKFPAERGGCSYPVERRWVVWGRLRLGPDEASPLLKIE